MDLCFLPPEVKLQIVESLPVPALKSLRLVDSAWSPVGTSQLEIKGTLSLNRDSVNRIIEGTFGSRFKSFRLGTPPRPLADFGERVVLALSSLESDVENLTFAEKWGSAEQGTSRLLRQILLVCPNLHEIRMINSNCFWDGVLSQGPLPTLIHCKTVCWDHSEGYPAQSFVAATPNVETLVDPWTSTLNYIQRSHSRWPNLSGVKFNRQQADAIRTFNRRLRTLAFSELNLSAGDALEIMKKFSNTLEVFEMNDCSIDDYRMLDQYSSLRPPTMSNLQTLSIVNVDPGHLAFMGAGFIFGSVVNPMPESMKLETHFPSLQTLRFTLKKGSVSHPSIFVINYIPFLLSEGDLSSLPNIKTLELDWPDLQKNPQLWRDWTRRMARKFLNVEGNPHIYKWKSLIMEGELEEEELVGPDLVEQEWVNYLTIQETRRSQPPVPMKQTKFWRQCVPPRIVN